MFFFYREESVVVFLKGGIWSNVFFKGRSLEKFFLNRGFWSSFFKGKSRVFLKKKVRVC